jgi:hypothetical protein
MLMQLWVMDFNLDNIFYANGLLEKPNLSKQETKIIFLLVHNNSSLTELIDHLV